MLKDSATLTGGLTPTGTITFDLYAPRGVDGRDTEVVTVSGNGTYTTPAGYTLPTTGTVIGTYQWVASYSGDVNNSPASDQGSRRAGSGPRPTPASARTPAPAA